MPLKRRNISNLILFAIIAIALYLIQRLAPFEVSTFAYEYAGYREMLYSEYIFVFAALIGVSAWYIYVEKKKGDLKLHIPFIILLSALFIISTVMILVFPSRLELDIPVYIRVIDSPTASHTELDYIKYGCSITTTIEQKILYILVTFTVLYMVYITIWVLPRKIRHIQELNMFMYIIIVFAIVLMIFSWIKEFNRYVDFFTALPDPTQPVPSGINSFVGNRNSFGVSLTFAVFACLYLHHQNRKWWFLPFPVIFSLQTILIGSKTNALICFTTLVIYFITSMVFRFKKHLKSSLIILGVVFAIIVTIVTLSVVHYFNNDFMVDAFNSVDKMFNYFIVKAFNVRDTFSGRDRQYEKVVQLLNMGYWGCGIGYGLFNYVFRGMENISVIEEIHDWDSKTINTVGASEIIASDSPHSSFFEILGTGGIVTLVLYVIMLVYLIFAMVRVFKKHKATVLLCATFLLGALLHGMTEAPSLFFMSPVLIDSLLFTVFVALPILSIYYHSKHPSENRKFLADYVQNEHKLADFDKSSVIAKSIYFVLTPAVIIVCVLAPIMYNPLEPGNIALLVLMIVLAALFVVAPIIAQLISDRKTKFGQFLLKVVLPYYAVVGVFTGFIYLYKLAFGPMTLNLLGLMLIGTFVAYFALFSLSSFFFKNVGIISLLMNKVCNITYKYQKKYIEISDEKDSLTLEEKFFWLITPKRFRKYETRDN